MNRRFQEYKECGIVFVDHLNTDFKIRVSEFSLKPDKGLMKIEYNRAKEKRKFERRIEEEWETEI